MAEFKMVMSAEEAAVIKTYQKMIQQEVKLQREMKRTNKKLKDNKDSHDQMSNSWQKNTESAITSLTKYVVVLGSIKSMYDSIADNSRKIRETQDRLGEATITQGNPVYNAIARQNKSSISEARTLTNTVAAELLYTNPAQARSVIEAQSSMGMTREMSKNFNMFAAASSFSPEQSSAVVSLMDKMDLDKDAAGQKLFMGQLFGIQQAFPTATGPFSSGYTKFGPVANAYGRDRISSMVDYASAITMKGSEDEAAELMRQLYRDVIDKKTGRFLAKKEHLSSVEYERKYNTIDKQYDLYRDYMTKNLATPEGMAEIKKTFEGRQVERASLFFSQEGEKQRAAARISSQSATADNFYNVLSPIVDSDSFKASRRMSEAKLKEFDASDLLQRGTAEIAMGKAAYDEQVARGEISGMERFLGQKVMSWFHGGLEYDQFKPIEEASAMQIGRLKESAGFRELSYNQKGDVLDEFSGRSQNALDVGRLAILIDRLIKLTEDGNKLTTELVSKQRDQVNKLNTVIGRSPQVDNPNRHN